VRTGEDPGGQGVPQDVNACAVPTQPLIGGVNGFLDHAPTDRLAQRGDMSNENLASPVAPGSGSTSARRPLPKVIRMVPACQSMSSRLSRTTRCF